ncbi:protein singles bar-like isoform X2 [Penaeus chinensis]|uniref:protein singles bar-like isoform X2 n=1 Tax=Penaeus chinensis TaxID=139456 RepID=UPI001FB61AC8|nr:protein singles bar-like isoform X2 [Penaeus chinensis]
MSTQVTVHRMVTTTTTSAFLINVGYLKTFPGILKIFQIILGCVAIGIIGHYIPWTRTADFMVPELFFLLIATACLITTTLLLMSCLCSIATASIIPKTLFETLYHIVSSLLYFTSALYLLIYLTERKYHDKDHVAKTAASALGLVNTALYILSSIYSVRTFRRG